MTEYPHVPAAFINSIREEGTKDEALDWLQKQWNETCYLRAALVEARRELKSECERRDEIIATTTKLWKDAEAALAEARGLLGAFYRADIDPHKYDRTAKWLERNP